MRFLKLGHIDRDEVVFATVEQVGERERGLGLAHSAGTNEHEHADRLVRIVERRTRRLDALADDLHRMGLANDAFAEVLLQREHGGDFVSSASFPAGMPVQAESTSPTIWPSTQTRIRPVSP